MNLDTLHPGVRSVLRKALLDRIDQIDDTLLGMAHRQRMGEDTAWIGHQHIFEREKDECQKLLNEL